METVQNSIQQYSQNTSNETFQPRQSKSSTGVLHIIIYHKSRNIKAPWNNSYSDNITVPWLCR